MTRSSERPGFGFRAPGWRAWAGLIVAPIVWGAHHQLGSNVAFVACDRGPDTLSLIAGVIGLVFIAASGWIGWKSWRDAGGRATDEADALALFVPLLSVMAATIFGLTILVQLSADFILPPCFG